MLARTHFTCAVLTVFLLAAGCSGPALTEPAPVGEASAGAPVSGTAGSSGAPAGGSSGAPISGPFASGAGGAAGFGGAGAAGAGYAGAGSAGAGGAGAGAGAGGQPGVAGSSSVSVGNDPPAPAQPLPGWTLLWSDEFNAADGSGVDDSKWHHDKGGDGWGNQELEYYTDDAMNAQQHGGNLVMTATSAGASNYSCWYGACKYTSARLLTSGKFSAAYGRIEAHIKIPAGKGIWPAFWMLGDNVADGWPACGEIDIMEAIGSDPTTLHGSLHGPGYSGGSPLTATTKLPNGAKLSDDFHTYAVEWAPNSVKFFVDSTLYETRTPADVPAGKKWVYDHPFFLILNVAVGGTWPGSPDGSTPWPTQMLVDYVRVYKAN